MSGRSVAGLCLATLLVTVVALGALAAGGYYPFGTGSAGERLLLYTAASLACALGLALALPGLARTGLPRAGKVRPIGPGDAQVSQPIP